MPALAAAPAWAEPLALIDKTALNSFPDESVANASLLGVILRKEANLLKQNLALRKYGTKQGIARGRRLFASDIGNALSTEGGLITATALFFRKMPHRTAIAGSLYPQIAGQGVGITGGAIELGLDVSRSIKIKQLRLSLRSMTKRMRAEIEKLDVALAEYENSIVTAKLPSGAQDLKGVTSDARRAEFEILRKYRDYIVADFKQLQTRVASIGSAAYTEDFIGFARNTIGLIGNCVNVQGVLRGNKHVNGTGTILNTISASMITTRPLIATAVAHWRSRSVDAFLDKHLSQSPQTNVEPYGSADQKSVSALLLTVPSQDEPALRTFESYFGALSELNQKQTKTHKRTQILRFLREPIYGPTKIAQSTCGLVVNYGNTKDAQQDNRINAGGNVTYLTGQAFNITELMRERITDEVRLRKDRKEGTSVEQLMARQERILRSVIQTVDLQ